MDRQKVLIIFGACLVGCSAYLDFHLEDARSKAQATRRVVVASRDRHLRTRLEARYQTIEALDRDPPKGGIFRIRTRSIALY